MSSIIAWQNPPHDWRDTVRETAEQLRKRPGEWALIVEGDRWAESYLDELTYENGLEVRVSNHRIERDREGAAKRQIADLYARAPSA